MIKHGIIIICILTMAVLLQGCGTLGHNVSSKTVHVFLTSDGIITVNGKKTELPMLAQRLKRIGAGRDTNIKVSIHENTPDSKISEISKNLLSGGFFRVIFIKPKHTETGILQK